MHCKKMIGALCAGLMALSAVGCASTPASSAPFASADNMSTGSGFSVSVKVPDDFEGELNGRCLVAFATDTSEAQPYEQIDLYGVPVFGKTVYGLEAGDTIEFTVDDEEIIGFPFELEELPAQEPPSD